LSFVELGLLLAAVLSYLRLIYDVTNEQPVVELFTKYIIY